MTDPRAPRPLTDAERARIEELGARLQRGGDLYERARQRTEARDRVLDRILNVAPRLPARERCRRMRRSAP